MFKKVKTLSRLGEALQKMPEEIREFAYQKNNWFTEDNVNFCIGHWTNILTEENINNWISKYDFTRQNKNKTLGIICAGNIPLVGLHDVICGYLSGHSLKIKLSSSDDVLMKYAIESLIGSQTSNIRIENNFLKGIDAIIATGSNNTYRYFEYYFKSIPRILRKNRTSIAIVEGSETESDLDRLADDFFLYFGLGCRSISKVFLPKRYDLNKLFRAFYKYHKISDHNKYKNNYDYNRAIFLLEKIPFLENGFCIMKEDKNLHSPISIINYEFYDKIRDIEHFVEKNTENIQCIASNGFIMKNNVPFGETQRPPLDIYSDDVDTLKFLTESI